MTSWMKVFCRNHKLLTKHRACFFKLTVSQIFTAELWHVLRSVPFLRSFACYGFLLPAYGLTRPGSTLSGHSAQRDSERISKPTESTKVANFVSWPLCDSSIFRFSIRFYTFVFFRLFLLKLICYVSFNSRSHVTMYMDRQSISKPSN